MLVARLGKTGKKVCLILSQLTMLFVTGVLFKGAYAQAEINWDVSAPVTGISMAIFYGSGAFFAVLAGLLLLREFVRTVTGKIKDEELVGAGVRGRGRTA